MLISMATTKTNKQNPPENNKCWQKCGGIETPVHCLWKYESCTDTVGNSMVVPKIK